MAFKIVFIVVSFLSIEKAIAQPLSVQQKNLHYLDSIEQIQKIIECEGPATYTDKYRTKELKKDIDIIKVINAVFNNCNLVTHFNRELKKMPAVQVSEVESSKGLLKNRHVIISSSYLYIKLDIDAVDDRIIRKQCSFYTKTKGNCTITGLRILDFNLLKKFLLSEIDFPIRTIDRRLIIATGFLESNLGIVASKHRDFLFATSKPANEDWVNSIIINQYNSDSSCCYSYTKAPKSFIALIKNGKEDLIKDLLYSPNYFYAVNAMEAIIYLSSINRISIDDSIRKKIESLKQGNFPITVRNEDVYRTFDGHANLKMSDERIIKKYLSSL